MSKWSTAPGQAVTPAQLQGPCRHCVSKHRAVPTDHGRHAVCLLRHGYNCTEPLRNPTGLTCSTSASVCAESQPQITRRSRQPAPITTAAGDRAAVTLADKDASHQAQVLGKPPEGFLRSVFQTEKGCTRAAWRQVTARDPSALRSAGSAPALRHGHRGRSGREAEAEQAPPSAAVCPDHLLPASWSLLHRCKAVGARGGWATPGGPSTNVAVLCGFHSLLLGVSGAGVV